MTFEIKKLPNEPIYIATFTNPFQVEDSAEIEKVMAKNLAKTAGTVCYVSDMSAVDVSFSDMVAGLAEAFKPHSNSFYADERVHILTVGSQELIKFASDAAAQDQYGGISIEVFGSVAEAVDVARTKYLS